jgi:hypothetical protein
MGPEPGSMAPLKPTVKTTFPPPSKRETSGIQFGLFSFMKNIALNVVHGSREPSSFS